MLRPPGCSIEDLVAADQNHKSFNDKHGETVAPGLQQAQKAAKKGHARIFPSRAAAEAVYGKLYPAPLGNIRKLNLGGLSWKDRLFLDLKASRANRRVRLQEPVVLPRSIDHARDMAQLSCPSCQAGGPDVSDIPFPSPSSAAIPPQTGPITVMVLDHSDAFNEVPLDEREIPFCCADLDGEGFIVFLGWDSAADHFPMYTVERHHCYAGLPKPCFLPSTPASNNSWTIPS